jgi:hypothetical protein
VWISPRVELVLRDRDSINVAGAPRALGQQLMNAAAWLLAAFFLWPTDGLLVFGGDGELRIRSARTTNPASVLDHPAASSRSPTRTEEPEGLEHTHAAATRREAVTHSGRRQVPGWRGRSWLHGHHVDRRSLEPGVWATYRGTGSACTLLTVVERSPAQEVSSVSSP